MTAKSFRYFTLGSSTIVRVAYDSFGLTMGAETPDPITGELKIKNDMLSRLERNWETEEIDAEQFESLRRAYSDKTRGRGTS